MSTLCEWSIDFCYKIVLQQMNLIMSGWNQTGNLFDFLIPWGEVMVYNPVEGAVLSIADAHTAGWVSQYMYWYDTAASHYILEDA